MAAADDALASSLAAAEACLAGGGGTSPDPKAALQHCKAALKADKKSVAAFL